MASDYTQLPPNLPEPIEDGACKHLTGLVLPSTSLDSTDGKSIDLRQTATKWLVIYVYPQTGGQGTVLPDNWDMIPGARGCTPQNCSFRDRHPEFERVDATVYGLSAQELDLQREFVERVQLPFPLLNDSSFSLAEPPLKLPVFSAGARTLYRRVTLVAKGDIISKVFYPVFPPDKNADEVLGWLKRNEVEP